MPISDPKGSKRSFYAIFVPIYELDYNRIVPPGLWESAGFLWTLRISVRFGRVPKSRIFASHANGSRKFPIAVEGDLVRPETFKLEEWESNTKYIVQTITLPRSHWKLISPIPRDELLEELEVRLPLVCDVPHRQASHLHHHLSIPAVETPGSSALGTEWPKIAEYL